MMKNVFLSATLASVAWLAATPLSASGQVLAKDSFQRLDSDQLGHTEIGDIRWISFATAGANGGQKVRPAIMDHRLWFASTVVGRDKPEQETGVGLMSTFLDRRFTNFSLHTKLEFASRAPGDGWLGVSWGRSKIQASVFDVTGYLLRISPDGTLVLFYNNEPVAKEKGAIALGAPFDVHISSSGAKTVVAVAGQPVFDLPTATPADVYGKGGYVALLSYHAGMGAAGTFERGVHSVVILPEADPR